jgi:hypothetical protein
MGDIVPEYLGDIVGIRTPARSLSSPDEIREWGLSVIFITAPASGHRPLIQLSILG